MLYVGLDVHKARSSYTILDENGKQVKERTVHGNWAKVLETLGEIPDPFSICFEASCGYGYLYDHLAQRAAHVAVGHPGSMRLIFKSKKKNDRIDGRKLAKLLYLDAVPTVYVPKTEVRTWRSLILFRQKLLAKVVMAKNQIRALLRSLAVAPLRGGNWLWTKKGQHWLGEQALGVGLDVQKQMLQEELVDLRKKIKTLEKELARRADTHPGVRLLRTIPGVGIRTAEAFVAWIDDARRFARSNQIGSYVGLIPCQDSSGGVDRLGHITRDGPSVLRKLLCEAAWQHVRRDPAGKTFFARVMHDDPDRRKIALVAAAHRLSRVMLAMLKSGEAYRVAPLAPGKTAGIPAPGAGREAPEPPVSSLPAPATPPLSPPSPVPTGRKRKGQRNKARTEERATS
jgi:transposase